MIPRPGHYLVLALLKHGKPQMKSELLDRLCDQNLTKLAMHASAAQVFVGLIRKRMVLS